MFSIKFEALTLGQKIGEGGFGIVYKGTYQFAPAAIKQLRVDNLSPEAEEEFNREANIMAQLHHPNVVHFYGYCTVPKCLVMEYMPRGSLFKVLHSREPFDWNFRIRIATDIASGLAFLHSKSILHRDIKSLNVLLDGQWAAKLTDFGLSRVKNETKSKSMANKTNQAVGTTQWMAPELFKRKAVYTQKSDIYSLGITFWELASRKIPYVNDEQEAIPAFVQQGEREDIPSDCPPKLAHLIQQCWAGDPGERPNADEVALFMTSDAKTLKEQAGINASAGYQLSSQVALNFVPAQVTLHASAANLMLQPDSPVAAAKRRGSILNLTDKKEEQEKIWYVLEELRTFFIEERYLGEKTENYAIYNEYLKKANSSAQLAYKPTQNKHILYMSGKPFEDSDTAAQEISKMIDALSLAKAPQKPQVVAPVKSLEQKNPPGPAMLTQFNQTAKPSPKVKASDLREFLRLVVEGGQDEAEAMLKSNPTLALLPGDVTDLSKRTFTNITGFQYAVWALDWRMWTMIRKHLPDEAAREQVQGFETGAWVKSHGVHAQQLLDNLVKALQLTIDLYNAKKIIECDKAWVQQVGGAQLLLPAHVINEYCSPTRSFSPVPNFRDAVILPCARAVGKGEWFTATYNGGKLAEKFAVVRGPRVWDGCAAVSDWRFAPDWPCSDRDSVRALSSTRTAQREELIAELRHKNVSQKFMISPAPQPAANVSPMLANTSQVVSPSSQLGSSSPSVSQNNELKPNVPFTVSADGHIAIDVSLKGTSGHWHITGLVNGNRKGYLQLLHPIHTRPQDGKTVTSGKFTLDVQCGDTVLVTAGANKGDILEEQLNFTMLLKLGAKNKYAVAF
jgi:tRNA A-37 threonylcarbamoyl transferase component Bud32